MRCDGVILQHGAEFVADLLVDQGDNLGVRNHLKASSEREGIASASLRRLWNDSVPTQAGEEIPKHLLRIDAILETSAPRFNSAGDVVVFHETENGVSEGLRQYLFVGHLLRRDLADTRLRQYEAYGVIPVMAPEALRLGVQPVQTTLKCEFCVNFIRIGVLAWRPAFAEILQQPCQSTHFVL